MVAAVGLDNSPIKKAPPVIEDEPSSNITKIDFGLARRDEDEPVKKQMPTLIPAPTLNRNNSNEGASNEPKPLPKIVKKEKFWEYEEVDEKPKEKRKRKLVSYRLIHPIYSF